MGMIAEDYERQLLALVPPGAAWQAEPSSRLRAVLRAMAEEMARIDSRGDVLVAESDPRTTNELLFDWERIAGLPDACEGIGANIDVRRSQLLLRVAGTTGQTPQYYIDVAARLGYEITVDELMAYEAGHLFNGVEITTDEWVFVWRVNAPETTIRQSVCGTAVCGDRIRTWGNELLECVIDRLKPAHTHVLYSYS